MRVNKFKCSRPGNRWRYFRTIEEAKRFCDRAFARTGVIVTIVEL